jgi:hypothetical protein
LCLREHHRLDRRQPATRSLGGAQQRASHAGRQQPAKLLDASMQLRTHGAGAALQEQRDRRRLETVYEPQHRNLSVRLGEPFHRASG